MDCQPPLGEWDFGMFHDGADRDGELLLAFVAIEQARTMRFALYAGDAAHGATVRANGAIGPEPIFEIQPRRFVVGDQFEEFERGDCRLAHTSIVDESRTGVKYIIPYCFWIAQNEAQDAELREQALAKLSQDERRALGL